MMGNNQAKKLAALQHNDKRRYEEWLAANTKSQRPEPKRIDDKLAMFLASMNAMIIRSAQE